MNSSHRKPSQRERRSGYGQTWLALPPSVNQHNVSTVNPRTISYRSDQPTGSHTEEDHGSNSFGMLTTISSDISTTDIDPQETNHSLAQDQMLLQTPGIYNPGIDHQNAQNHGFLSLIPEERHGIDAQTDFNPMALNAVDQPPAPGVVETSSFSSPIVIDNPDINNVLPPTGPVIGFSGLPPSDTRSQDLVQSSFQPEIPPWAISTFHNWYLHHARPPDNDELVFLEFTTKISSAIIHEWFNCQFYAQERNELALVPHTRSTSSSSFNDLFSRQLYRGEIREYISDSVRKRANKPCNHNGMAPSEPGIVSLHCLYGCGSVWPLTGRGKYEWRRHHARFESSHWFACPFCRYAGGREEHLSSHLQNIHKIDIAFARELSPKMEIEHPFTWKCSFCPEHEAAWTNSERFFNHVYGHFQNGKSMLDWKDYDKKMKQRNAAQTCEALHLMRRNSDEDDDMQDDSQPGLLQLSSSRSNAKHQSFSTTSSSFARSGGRSRNGQTETALASKPYQCLTRARLPFNSRDFIYRCLSMRTWPGRHERRPLLNTAFNSVTRSVGIRDSEPWKRQGGTNKHANLTRSSAMAQSGALTPLVTTSILAAGDQDLQPHLSLQISRFTAAQEPIDEIRLGVLRRGTERYDIQHYLDKFPTDTRFSSSPQANGLLGWASTGFL